MRNLLEKHGDNIRFAVLVLIGLASNAGWLWLNSHFVTRGEFEKHCEIQTVAVSNFTAHLQITPEVVKAFERKDAEHDKLLTDHDTRIRGLETRH